MGIKKAQDYNYDNFGFYFKEKDFNDDSCLNYYTFVEFYDLVRRSLIENPEKRTTMQEYEQFFDNNFKDNLGY